jgi:sulfate adenylyltransferase subunit 2
MRAARSGGGFIGNPDAGLTFPLRIRRNGRQTFRATSPVKEKKTMHVHTSEFDPHSKDPVTKPPLDPHLKALENEAIYIFREVAAEFEKPVMLYSIGKDSSVLLHLARKAFFPGRVPFPLLHVDTGWKFPEMIAFRDATAEKYDLDLIVHTNPRGAAEGIGPFTHGSSYHTDVMKTEALRQALDAGKYDAAFGGARRDEEASRAKERIYSFRTPDHKWDPRNQRPELWNIYNGMVRRGESVRAFPLSNWTEVDIWRYIQAENIELPPLYYAKRQKYVERDGMLMWAEDPRFEPLPGEQIQEGMLRFRTLGCWPLTGGIRSQATTLDAVIAELEIATVSERQGRAIDRDQAGSMEKKKREGYF